MFNFITASPRRGEGWCGGPGVLKLLDRKIMAGLRGCELRSSPSYIVRKEYGKELPRAEL